MIGRSAPSGIALAALAVATACSVDERTLLRSTGFSGADGVSSYGSSASTGAVGGGEDAGPPPPLPVCDYGASVQAGCETLVANPGFTKDASGWSAEEGSVSISWNDNDAAHSRKSGSLSVVNSLSGEADGIAARGAAVCLPTAAGKAYGMAGDLFIPQGQGAALDGGAYAASAGLSVIFYASVGCEGATLSNATSGLLDEPGVWAHREGRALAPDGANSMSMRLATFKNFREFKFEARFDNILFEEE